MLRRFRSTTFLAVLIASVVNSLSTPAVLADVLVSSFGTDQVLRFNETTGEFLGAFATSSSGIKLSGPFGVTYGPDGNLYVTSFNTGEVLRYNGVTGKFIDVFARASSAGLTKSNLRDLNFGPDGNLYVAEGINNSILRFNGKGEFLDVFASPDTSPLSSPYGIIFDDDDHLYVASGGTSSVLRFDIKSKAFIDTFVPSGSGGLNTPIGMQFGPDGNIYVSSNGTSSVLRYHGKTGAFIDAFVPSGSGGLAGSTAARFGGSNSDLYIGSNDNNSVLRYDRTTGKFLGVVASNETGGLTLTRGVILTGPEPTLRVTASPSVSSAKQNGFIAIKVQVSLQDYVDPNPKVELVSITENDPHRDPSKDIRGAEFGTDDRDFSLLAKPSHSDSPLIYTITYRATNNRGRSAIATTTVVVPSKSISKPN